MKKEYTKPEIRFERFTDIDGFPDYQIGDNGTVVSYKNGKVRILKPMKAFRYLQVHLCKNGIRYKKYIHHLVAKTFILNPENKPCIDHIDGNSLNNSKENLRWCTQKENINNPISRKRLLKTCSKPVVCYNNYGIIKVYLYIHDAEKDGFQPTHVCECCKGKRKSHKGHQFRYATEGDVN